MEASHPSKHLLAVGVELFQLILNQHSIKGSTLLNQVLPKHNQSINLVGVKGDLLLEALQRKL